MVPPRDLHYEAELYNVMAWRTINCQVEGFSDGNVMLIFESAQKDSWGGKNATGHLDKETVRESTGKRCIKRTTKLDGLFQVAGTH